MIDAYISSIEKKKNKKQLKNEVLFGQEVGSILLVVSFLNFLESKDSLGDIMPIIGMITGSILLILGIVFPYALNYPSKIINKVINSIFEIIFMIILSIIYVLLIIPVGIFSKNRWVEQYGFYSWEKAEDKKFKSVFKVRSDYKNTNEKEKKTNRLLNIFNVLAFFVERKQIILIPVVVLLVVFGLLFFFVTSSVVTPMIYTLF